MRLTARTLRAAALLTLLAFTVLPALAQDGSVITLRRKFTVNEIRAYKMVMDMNGEVQMGETPMPLNMQMVMVYREKVAGVKDGKATIHTTIESMKMFMNGQEFVNPMMPDLSKLVITTVVDDRNRVLEVKGLDQFTTGSPGMGAMGTSPGMSAPAPLPEGPIKVGDTWEVQIPIPNVKDFQITGKQTFVGIEKVNGIDAARIKFEFEAPYDKLIAAAAQAAPAGTPAMTGSMKMVGYSYFDLATGNLLKFDGDMATSLQMSGGNNPQMPQSMQMNMTAKIAITQVADARPTQK